MIRDNIERQGVICDVKGSDHRVIVYQSRGYFWLELFIVYSGEWASDEVKKFERPGDATDWLEFQEFRLDPGYVGLMPQVIKEVGGY
jgi:hypothetical protein